MIKCLFLPVCSLQLLWGNRMKYAIYFLLLIFSFSCSSTDPKVSAKDPNINIYINPCSCTKTQFVTYTEQTLLSNGLDQYTKKNNIVLDPVLKEEILQEPKRFLYDTTIEFPKTKETFSLQDAPEDELLSGGFYVKETGVPVNPPKKNTVKRPYDKGSYMNFDGYDDEAEREKIPLSPGNLDITVTPELPKANAKLNTQEVETYLQDKEVKGNGKYKVYSKSPSYGNKGLEAIKSFKSDRLEYKQQLEKRRDEQIRLKKDQGYK
jgi:hypothetical protein